MTAKDLHDMDHLRRISDDVRAGFESKITSPDYHSFPLSTELRPNVLKPVTTEEFSEYFQTAMEKYIQTI